MKKFLILFAMMAFVGTMASAQDAPKKTCTKSKAACAKSKTACTKAKTVSAEDLPACPVKAAAQLASQDENIMSKTCAKSGNVTYYQKSVCASTGKVTMKQVKYDDRAKAFVNVAPTKMEAKTLKTASGKKKACCSKTKKASCSKTAAKKSCSKKTTAAQAKQVKLEDK